jgi:hypothetical protein
LLRIARRGACFVGSCRSAARVKHAHLQHPRHAPNMITEIAQIDVAAAPDVEHTKTVLTVSV